MERVNSFGVIKVPMTVISIRTIFTELENMCGRMEEYSMVNGLITKWKVKVHLPGAMAEDTSDNTKMIRSTAKVHLSGQMAESILENGTKANNMDRVPT